MTNLGAKVRLPVVRTAIPFNVVKEREAKLWERIDKMSVAELSRGPILSANTKTGVSWDFSTSRTCKTTPTCGAVCYGLKTTTMQSVLVRRLTNTALVHKATTDQVVDHISRRLDGKRAHFARRGVKQDFLRVPGTGELLAQTVKVLNRLVEVRPDITFWVVSRKVGLAANLAQAPNLYLSISTDATTDPSVLDQARRLAAQRTNTYLNYLRLTPDDLGIPDAHVVYDTQNGFPPPWFSPQCPVDAGEMRTESIRGKGGTACARCRHCFS